jgi:hypothetical protein
MKSATMGCQHPQEKSVAPAAGRQRVSSMLALGQWLCVPLLSFGALLLAATFASSIFLLHDGAHVFGLAASVAGAFAPVVIMVRARRCHRLRRFTEAVVGNGLLIACTAIMLANIVRDGRLF